MIDPIIMHVLGSQHKPNAHKTYQPEMFEPLNNTLPANRLKAVLCWSQRQCLLANPNYVELRY